MKIWFAADIPKESHDDPGIALVQFSTRLKTRGHLVKVITRGTIASKNYFTFAWKFSVYYILKSFHPPDWIIANATDSVFCALIIRLFKLKTKIILYNHGWEEKIYIIEKRLSKSHISNPATWKITLIKLTLLRLALRLCTYCLSVNIQETRFIGNKYSQTKNKLLFIPYGVETQPQAYWLHQTDTPVEFLTIGNLSWKNNLNHTIHTFYHLRKIFLTAHLTCVDTGVDEHTLLKKVKLKVEGLSNFRSVAPSALIKLYAKCPFMIVSSRYEGYSIAILTALSYGIIVFASANESNREIIKDGFNGYIITGSDVRADAEFISEKISVGDNLKSLRQHAFATAQQYSWDKQVLRLEKILCKH